MTKAEVEQFQRATRLIVLPIANANGPRLGDGETPDGREGIAVRALTVILYSTDKKNDCRRWPLPRPCLVNLVGS